MIRTRRTFLSVVILMVISMTTLCAKRVPVIRISVENTLSHVQTQAVQTFAEQLATKLSSHYDVRFYHSASLYKDADILRSLTQGKVEIAVPGTWHFDRYVPEVGVFLLPSLYARKADATYALLASDVGERIISSIEEALGVTVFGSFIDLGSTQTFTTTNSVQTPSDFAGKVIRVAGGLGNSLRISALGAKPLTIAWPMLSNALQYAQIDGVLTSYETVASAKLWESSLAYVYEDNQYFAQYVPIASNHFWNRLPLWVQQTIVESWEAGVKAARDSAQIAQEEAKQKVIAHGLKVIEPSTEALIATRTLLVKHEATMAKLLGVPSDLYTDFSHFFTFYEESL